MNVQANKASKSEQKIGIYPYYVVGVLTLITMMNFVDRSLIAILSPAIKEDLGLADWQLGALKGIAFAVLYALLAIPIAQFADRTSRIGVVGAAVTGWSIFTMLCGFAQNFTHLLFARIGMSIGEAGGTAPAHALLSDYFPKEKRGTALSIINLGVPLGVAFAFLGGGWLVTTFDWRTAFIVMSTPGIVFGVLALFTIREPERGRLDSGSSDSFAGSDKSPIRVFLGAMRHLFAIPSFCCFTVAMTFAAMGSYSIGAWIVDFFARAHASTPPMSLFFWLGMAALFGQVAGVFLGGFLVDKLSVRNRAYYGILPGLATLILVPLYLWSLWTNNVGLALGLQFPVGAFAGVFIGPSFAIVQTLAPVSIRALAAAIFLMVFNLFGMGVGPTAVGVVSSLLDSSFGSDIALRIAISIAVLCYLLASMFFLLASRYLNNDWAKATENGA